MLLSSLLWREYKVKVQAWSYSNIKHQIETVHHSTSYSTSMLWANIHYKLDGTEWPYSFKLCSLTNKFCQKNRMCMHSAFISPAKLLPYMESPWDNFKAIRTDCIHPLTAWSAFDAFSFLVVNHACLHMALLVAETQSLVKKSLICK